MILDKDNKAIVDELKLSDDDIEMALSKVDDIINTSNITAQSLLENMQIIECAIL